MENSDLFYIVLVFVLVWIIGVIVFLLFLIKKYTFGHWTTENPNPYVLETFGLPRGVIRGILTLSVLFVILLLEIINLQMPLINKNGQLLSLGNSLFIPEERYKEFMIAFQMIIAFYFGSKVMHHITKADERKSKKIAETIEDLEARTVCQEAPDEFAEEGAVG